MTLKKALEKTKHIHFWDNGDGSLYSQTKKEFEKIYKETEEYPKPIFEFSFSDFSGEGYAPGLVIALANKLGITVDSI